MKREETRDEQQEFREIRQRQREFRKNVDKFNKECSETVDLVKSKFPELFRDKEKN